MIRWIGITLLFAVLMPASTATEEYLVALKKQYNFSAESDAGKRECANCHVSNDDFEFNKYGSAINTKGLELGPALFLAVESEDSDGDGVSNGDEWKNGGVPGDPKLGGAKATTSVPVEAEERENPMLPKSAHHPAIVHFPIALFIAGLLLDFLGLVRKDKTLLHAGWYNIVLASITSLAAVVTGLGAMVMMKFPLRGNVQQHLIFTLLATVIMWTLVFMRVHRHEKMNVTMRIIYYILAAAGMFILSWAGHVGGVVAGTA